MAKRDSYGHVHFTVGGSTADVLMGEDDVSDWDEEELLRGRRRGTNGQFWGRNVKVVPQEVHQERIRRNLTETIKVMQRSSKEAAEQLVEIAIDPTQKTEHRLRAIEMILNWCLGKPRQSVDMTVTPMRPYESVVLNLLNQLAGEGGELAIGGGTEAEVIDAEVVEDNDDGIIWESEPVAEPHNAVRPDDDWSY
jgi:hypothetical protein